MIPQIDPVAADVAPDENQRQNATVFFGYVGATTTNGIYRLYDEGFQSWCELRESDILHQLQNTDPGGRSYLWVARDAEIICSRARTALDVSQDEAEAVDTPGGTLYPRR